MCTVSLHRTSSFYLKGLDEASHTPISLAIKFMEPHSLPQWIPDSINNLLRAGEGSDESQRYGPIDKLLNFVFSEETYMTLGLYYVILISVGRLISDT